MEFVLPDKYLSQDIPVPNNSELNTYISDPKYFKSSDIVITSFTNGTLFIVIFLLLRIVDANIGRVAFLEPDILTVPDKLFLPLIISFCIN